MPSAHLVDIYPKYHRDAPACRGWRVEAMTPGNPYLGFLRRLPPDYKEDPSLLGGLQSWLGFAGAVLGTGGQHEMRRRPARGGDEDTE